MRETGQPEPMYLVERYWPGVDEARLRDALPRLERAAEEMAAQEIRVEHIGSLLIPRDQVVFSLIRAASEEQVRAVNELASLPVDRISVVTPHGFGSLSNGIEAKEVGR